MNRILNLKFIDDCVDNQEIFGKTYETLKLCLINWWNDNEKTFLDDMGAVLDTIFNNYRFEQAIFYINKSFLYSPTLYYIFNSIRVYDENDTEIITYTAYFDERLEIFDDKIS